VQHRRRVLIPPQSQRQPHAADVDRPRLGHRHARQAILALTVSPAPRMVFLGYGKYVRSDRIYALQPIEGAQRGGGHRTYVWVEGITEPVVASRTERSILAEMGQTAAMRASIAEEALGFVREVADQADRVGPMTRTAIRNESGLDLESLARRARRLLSRAFPSPHDASHP